MVPKLSNKSECYLNAEWIEQALKYSGTISMSAAVASIEASTLSGGFMADTYLIAIKYARSNEAGPTSVVAKFPSSNPNSLAAGQEMGAYLREINFYKYLAPKLKMRLPACYFAEIDDDGAQFALMLEDLNPAEMLDEKFCNIEKAQRSIQELAMLHADTWNDTTFKDYDWMSDFSNAAYFEQLSVWASQGWELVKKTANELHKANSPLVAKLPNNFVSLGDRFVQKLSAIPSLMNNRMCLIHCDYRLANLLYKGDDESIALDWQTYHLGLPGFDTYYFINSTYEELEVEDCENILLKAYYQTLQESGVTNYTWAECLEDNQLGAFYRILMMMQTAYGTGAVGGIPELLKEKMFRTFSVDWKLISDNKMLERL